MEHKTLSLTPQLSKDEYSHSITASVVPAVQPYYYYYYYTGKD